MSVYTSLSRWRGTWNEASIKSKDYLAVATRLKLILTDISTAYFLMVIYLAIDG
jgi:hypothetical protein